MNFLRRLFAPGPASLILLSLLAISMVFIRLRSTDSLRFIFLIWNLFLAWIPWAIAWWMTRRERPAWVLWLLGVLWLLFLPNAPYILTDLFHLRSRTGIPLWYDLVMIMAFAWSALAWGLFSIGRIQALLSARVPKAWTALFTPLAIFLSAYGVYLGRYGRWNSWDLLSSPDSLLRYALDPVADPDKYVNVWAFTLIFGGFIYLIYRSVFQRPSNVPAGA